MFEHESQLGKLPAIERRTVRRAGFTLVEMLIVLAIVAVIAALGFGSLMLAAQRARIRGTEALIAKIDAKLQQRLNEFNQRRSSIRTLQCDLALAGGDPSRAHVIAIVRSMRQEFPESFSIDRNRASDGVDNNGIGAADEPSEIIAGQWNPVDIDGVGAPEQAFTELSSAAVGYLRCVEKAFSEAEIVPGRFSTLHTTATARAECLYMIVTSCGTDAADFAPDEVKDSDEDGLPEFIDKWGHPVQFFLWPSYYTSPKQKPGEETDPDDPSQLLTQQNWWSNTTPPCRTDFERLFHTLTHFAGQPKGFRTYPLIISAGPDEGFGFECDLAFVGDDGEMGTFDDAYRLPLPPSPPVLHVPGLGLRTLANGSRISPAMRMIDSTTPNLKTVSGFGMDGDNIDNHHLRAR